VVVIPPQPPGVEVAAFGFAAGRRSLPASRLACKWRTGAIAANLAPGPQPGLSGCAKHVCSVQVSHVSCPFAGQLAATKSCQAVCSLLAAMVVGREHTDAAVGAAGAGFAGSGVCDAHESSMHRAAASIPISGAVFRTLFMNHPPIQRLYCHFLKKTNNGLDINTLLCALKRNITATREI
jgi:hypothetical protein